jgi:large subunit ribosomal protein L24
MMQTAKPVTKPSKQRKMVFQAPDHIRHKLFAAPLSPELKTSHGIKSLPVRSGDAVRVMRGDHKGFEGKITRVDRTKYRIYVEGLTREKVDGTAIFVPIHPSKVMITTLNLEDKWRKETLAKKKAVQKELAKVEEVPAKPRRKVVEAKEEKIEEKAVALEEKPKRRRKKAVEKPRAKRVKEKVEEAEAPAAVAEEEKEKPKPKKPRAKRKTSKKTETETEGGT